MSYEAIALYDYEATKSSRINLSVGDVITVTSQKPNWSQGTTADGESGSFPTDFVKPLSEIETARAKYDYKAQNENQISFSQGDTVYVVLKEHKSWWEGIVKGGDQLGRFPASYVSTGSGSTRRSRTGSRTAKDGNSPDLSASGRSRRARTNSISQAASSTTGRSAEKAQRRLSRLKVEGDADEADAALRMRLMAKEGRGGDAGAQAELEKMQERYERMKAKMAKEREQFEREMEEAAAMFEEQMEKREAKWKRAEEKRRKNEEMLNKLQLNTHKEGEAKRKKLAREVAHLKMELEEMKAAREKDKEEMMSAQAERESELQDKLERAEKECRRLRKSRQEAIDAKLELEAIGEVGGGGGGGGDKKAAEKWVAARRKEAEAQESRVAKLEAKVDELRAREKRALEEATRQKKKAEVAERRAADALDEVTSAESQLLKTRAELKGERQTRWEMEKSKEELEAEVKKLRYYFLPPEEQREQRESKPTGDPVLVMEERRRAALKYELEELQDELEDVDDLRKRPVAEVQGQLVDALDKLDADMKDPYAEALSELMAAMDILNYSLKTKLVISVALTRGKVPLELMQELVVVAEETMGKDALNPFGAMESPEGVVMRCLKECARLKRRGEGASFAHELLETLVDLRKRREGKSDEVARFEILKDGEMPPVDEVFGRKKGARGSRINNRSSRAPSNKSGRASRLEEEDEEEQLDTMDEEGVIQGDGIHLEEDSEDGDFNPLANF